VMEERIENATSDWLIQPDWRLNLEIIQAVDPSKYVVHDREAVLPMMEELTSVAFVVASS